MVTAIILSNTKRNIINEVATSLSSMEGITHSETMLAFKAYSPHDLEAMFMAGM